MEYIKLFPSYNGFTYKYFNGDELISSGEVDLSSYDGSELQLSDNLYFLIPFGFYKKDGDNKIYLVIRVNVLMGGL